MPNALSKSFNDVSLLLNQASAPNDLRADGGKNGPSSSPADARMSRLGVAKRIYDMRRARSQFLPMDMFAEPAWDILLFLYMSHGEQQRSTVTAVCSSAGVPISTALRWVQRLATIGMVEKEVHPTDQRVSWVSLSPDAQCQLDRLFNCLLRQKNWS